jgi:hypothetical protein
LVYGRSGFWFMGDSLRDSYASRVFVLSGAIEFERNVRSGFLVMGDSLRDSYASRVFGLIGRSNLREMCDRIRFVSSLVCPRREGQLVRPRVRQGLKPLSQSECPLKRTEELVDVHRFQANLESVSTECKL